MKKYLSAFLVLFIASALWGQTADPGRTPRWDRALDYIKNGTMTLTYKSLTSPTITGTYTNSASGTYSGTNSFTGTNTFSGILKVVGNLSGTNFYVVSDGDSFKVRMHQYIYPLEMEIGNASKFSVDSSGNAIFAGTVSASAFSPTATSTIQGHEFFAISDGDSLTITPHQNAELLMLRVGGARKFSVDSAGNIQGKGTFWVTGNSTIPTFIGNSTVNGKFTFSNLYPMTVNTLLTADSITVTNFVFTTLTGNSAVNGKVTIGNSYPLVSSSTITADSLVAPIYSGAVTFVGKPVFSNLYPVTSNTLITTDSLTATTLQFTTLKGNSTITGKLTISDLYPLVSNSTITADTLTAPYFAGNTEVKGKLTIAPNYPLVSSSTVTADTLAATGGNSVIVDIDSSATAGGVIRWLKITVSKAGATGKPQSYWLPSDTGIVK